MPWKLDDAGNVVTDGGKPVFIHSDGKEFGFDGDGTVATIGRLKDESKQHREAREALETKYKGFDGIDDPDAARKALDTVRNLDAKKLVDAGEVEKMKGEWAKAMEAQYKPYVDKASSLEQQLYNEKIGSAFARTPLVTDAKHPMKLAIPADLVQARFEKHFKIEDGNTVAYDSHGNKIYSRTNPGEVAGFDEALATLVEQYPNKDSILAGSGASGSGISPGKGGSGGAKTMSRAQFDQLPVFEQGKFVRGGGKIID